MWITASQKKMQRWLGDEDPDLLLFRLVEPVGKRLRCVIVYRTSYSHLGPWQLSPNEIEFSL